MNIYCEKNILDLISSTCFGAFKSPYFHQKQSKFVKEGDVTNLRRLAFCHVLQFEFQGLNTNLVSGSDKKTTYLSSNFFLFMKFSLVFCHLMSLCPSEIRLTQIQTHI